MERVIPLGACGMRLDLEPFEIFAFHFLASPIEAAVQERFDSQSGGRARPSNVTQHDFQRLEGFPLPIHADVAKQAMLDWVPL